MAKKFSDFQARVAAILQDAGAILAPGDRDENIRQAIEQRYSKDRAREMVTDQAGNGTSDLALPNSDAATFEDGYSRVKAIEYPLGSLPPALVDENDWQMYKTPTATLVRLLLSTPTAQEQVRMTWTARHKGDGSTVNASDFDAVCDFAAALCFNALAAKFAQTGDPTIGADTVNYRTKSQEYMGLGKAARQRYFDHMGIPDVVDKGQSSVGAAMAQGSMYETQGWGGDRLTHSRRDRN